MPQQEQSFQDRNALEQLFQNQSNVKPEERPLTHGQKAAGVSFNPSKDPVVDRVKKAYADIIDELNDQRNKAASGEAKRYYSKAISYTEDAQMNAVKAITWQW
jgi:hypothetical protein